MIAAQTISGQPAADPVLDWSALVEEGRASLAAMSDGRWTDFNAHDPGITILEAFCYALTDLGYRAGHPVADLVAGAPPLLGPAECLTTRAVTIADMRRAGIDVAGARNVWIEPAETPVLKLRAAPGSGDISFDTGTGDGSEAVTIAGVHRVVIEKSSREDLASAEVTRGVALRLHAERNLGEDFDSFAVLDPQPIAIAADVEIDDPTHAGAVLLALFARLDDYFSPEPRRRAIAALRAEGLASDAIYDGPRLGGGSAALPAESAGRRRVLHLSDVVAALSATPGVRATRRVRMATSLADADAGPVAWSLAVADDRAPVFDLAGSRIRLLAAGAVALDSRADAAMPGGGLVARYSSMRREAADTAGLGDDPPPPPGRDRRVGDYRALRFDLPRAYGVRPGSLGRAASDDRRAAANQLRAYLTLFDSVLANGFAQLAGAATLLAPAAGDGRSYFGQLPEQPSPEEDAVIAPQLDAAALQDLVEPAGGEAATARRGRFLGQQLARFGETAPAVPQPAARGFGGDTLSIARRQLATADVFLGDFARLTGGRGSGANLLADGDESPLADRIRLKLGLPEAAAGRLRIIEHILLRGVADDIGQALPLLAAAGWSDPYSLQLSFVFDRALLTGPGDADAVARIVRGECPAHLIAYLRWLDAPAFDAFASAHDRWLAALRRTRREALGLS